MISFLKRFIAGALTAVAFHAMRFWRHWMVLAGGVIFLFVILYIMVHAPLSFQAITVEIKQGDSAQAVAKKLADVRVIASKTALLTTLRIAGGDAEVHAGTYRFNTPENVFSIARRLVTAEYGIPAVRLTFTEGFTVREGAEQVAAAFPMISTTDFTKAAQSYEGYLFPDTYVFPPSATVLSIVAMMRANFVTKTTSLGRTGAATNHSLADIVVMASLIEKEARTDEGRRMVSGILWNRIDRDMPLQVDAVFGYIFGRDTYSPSKTDLRVDSPYNTYTHKGLPPGPINSPGLDALEAAANPAQTSYLYYLTGSDNLMHYATTYAGHKTNLQKYLK